MLYIQGFLKVCHITIFYILITIEDMKTQFIYLKTYSLKLIISCLSVQCVRRRLHGVHQSINQ